MEIHSDHFNFTKKRKVACRPATPQDNEVRETIRDYPKTELAVEVTDPSTKEKNRVTGRADWGFGYGRNNVAHGTFLVGMEAKRRDLLSTEEQQLLIYLAIIRAESRGNECCYARLSNG